MKEAIEILQKAGRDKFYGNIQLDFRAGEVTLVRKTETIKIVGTENTRHESEHFSR